MWAIFSQLTIWKKKENHKGCCCCWVGQVITINLFVTSKKRNHEFTNLACCIKASLFKPFFNGVLLLIYYFKKHFKHCFFISKALKDILQHFKFVNWWMDVSYFDVTIRLYVELTSTKKYLGQEETHFPTRQLLISLLYLISQRYLDVIFPQSSLCIVMHPSL